MTRSVEVVALVDTVAPVITLKGSASIRLNIGDVFTDPGATATDNKDGNLTADIVIAGSVDTSKVGVYTLTYKVTDAAGNKATPVTRSVEVVEKPIPVPTKSFAVKGPLHMARAYFDCNANEEFDTDEPSALTDTDGSYLIVGDCGSITSYNVIVQVTPDTIDYASGESYGNSNVEMKTAFVVNTSSVNTPLTTLLKHIEQFEGDSGDADSIMIESVSTSQLDLAFGLPDGIDLLTFNTHASGVDLDLAHEVETISQKIMLAKLAAIEAIEGAASPADGSAVPDGLDDVAHEGILDAMSKMLIETIKIQEGAVSTFITHISPPDSSLTGEALRLAQKSLKLDISDREHLVELYDLIIKDNESGPLGIEVRALGVDTKAVDEVLLAIEDTVSLIISNIGVEFDNQASDSFGTNESHVLSHLKHDAAEEIYALAQVYRAYYDANCSAEDVCSFASLEPGDYVTLDTAAGLAAAKVLALEDVLAHQSLLVAPAFTSSASFTAAENQTAIGTVTATDPQDDAVTFTVSGSELAITSVGVLSFVTAADYETKTSYTATVTATDGTNSSTQDIVVTVTDVDEVAPVITLLGDASIEVEVGAVFTDPGATATDAVDGDLTNDIVVTLLDTSAPGINIPANKIGNGPDTTMGTDDDVTVKGSYIAGDLTFVRPPVNLEAPAATWCPTGDGCTAGNSTAKDAVRMGSNLGFRRMQFAEAEGWCAAENGRLPTRAEITTHIMPLVGNGKAFETDLGWPQAKSKYWTADKNAAGDKAFVFTTRNSANDNVVNSVTNTVALANSPLWVMCVATAAQTVDTSEVGAYTLSYNVSDAAGNAATPVTRSVKVVAPVAVDTVAPVITLLGDASIEVEVGAVFTDPGATATDAVDGDLTADIVVTGTVDTSKVGTYTLSYNVSDAAGNSATPKTRSVEVVAPVDPVDTVAPVITLLGAASIEVEVGAVFTDPGATATDAVDGDLTADIVVTGTVDTSKVGAYTLSYNVADAAGNTATSVARTVNVVDAAIPFTLVIPADLTVNAAGFLTAVDLDPEGVASAIYGDGIAIDVVADQLGPFQSGRYEIVWSATNAGLTVTDTQILKVVPMVNLGVDVTTTEGNTLSIDVLLSGQAADYPVSVPFTVSGTAAEGDDYTVGSTGSVIITEGTMASISLSIVADEAAESEENVVITLGEATNAVLGVNTDQVITIVEGNLPPKVTLQISQAGIAGSTIAQNLGAAMINVAIFDANATDTHTVDWAKALLTLPNATVGVKVLEFDAAALAVGVYLVEVDISDGVETVSVAVNLNVLAQAPVLSADADSDGDGISDADEGYGDSDGDGIPDYLDNIAEPNLIPFGDSGAVVESEPGTQLILGGFCSRSGW